MEDSGKGAKARKKQSIVSAKGKGTLKRRIVVSKMCFVDGFIVLQQKHYA